jgi:hypothetical protein
MAASAGLGTGIARWQSRNMGGKGRRPKTSSEMVSTDCRVAYCSVKETLTTKSVNDAGQMLTTNQGVPIGPSRLVCA